MLAGCALALSSLVSQAQVQITTYHNDNLRTGLNSLEKTLTPSNVNAGQFGLLFNLPVDGQVYAQPLYLPGLNIPGKGVHNVLFVATEHNSLYAFDADSNVGLNAQPLWHVNFGPSVPNWDTGSDDITNEIGITSTPVISTASPRQPLLYVVSKTKTFDTSGYPVYTQQLHAISATTGAEQLGGPLVIQGQVPGVGDGTSNGVVNFNPLIQHSRAALLLVPPTTAGGKKAQQRASVKDNLLFVTFASHGDNGPYHGWVFVYDADKLQLLSILNTTPNGKTDPSGYPIAAGGIWQGGAGPASDGASIYFSTGNGSFDPTVGSFGDSILRIDLKTLGIRDYFTPSDQLNLDDYDTDLGSGGVMLLPASASGTSKTNLLVQSGKEGTIYLLNTANLGNYNASDVVVQELRYVMGGVWGAPAYFNNTIFYGPSYSPVVSFPIQNGQFTQTTPSGYSVTYYNFPGPTPSVSSNGTTNGIVWTIQADAYNSGGPAVLHAYDATNIGNELYNSSATQGRDQLDGAVKFAVPSVINGKVYVGTADAVGVFGLGTWAATPVVTPPSGNYINSVQVTVNESTPNATVYYTTDGSNPSPNSTRYIGPVTLTAGAIFKAKAFINGGAGSATAENDYLINAVIGTGNGLRGSYFNGLQDPSGSPTAWELDPVINFNWGGNSPIAGVAGTNWAGEWSGQIQAETTGAYTLTTNSDDGVRVYIDGQLVIDNYTYHGATYNSATLNFNAGQKYDIDIKYFQGGGASTLQLFWQAQGLPFQIVPTTQLYAAPAAPTLTPASGNYSGPVTVSASAPGSVIHYTVDGTRPTLSSPTYTGPVTLSASAAFEARAFVGSVGSTVAEGDYLINAIGTGNGLWGAYFNGIQDPAGQPTATELDPVINFNWNGSSPIAGVSGTIWAGEWTGQVQAETTGTYTFYTNSDDGVRVYINGQLVIDDYTYHAPVIDSGQIVLQGGQKYNIDIKYFQGQGGSLLQLFWSAPAIPYQLVPTSQLYSGH